MTNRCFIKYQMKVSHVSSSPATAFSLLAIFVFHLLWWLGLSLAGVNKYFSHLHRQGKIPVDIPRKAALPPSFHIGNKYSKYRWINQDGVHPSLIFLGISMKKSEGRIVVGRLQFSRTTPGLVKIWLKTHWSLTNSCFSCQLKFLSLSQPSHQDETSPGFSAFCSRGDNTRYWDFLWKSWRLFSMWRNLIVSVFSWGQHKHLSPETHPFLQALPSHHLPVYVTVFKSSLMSFADGQEQGWRAMDTQSQNTNRRKLSAGRPSRHVSLWKPLECVKEQI